MNQEATPGPERKKSSITKEEMDAWERRLASEGLPAEPELSGEAMSPAYTEALHEARIYYAMTEEKDVNSHHRALQSILDRAKASGATPDETALLDEDLMRQIQDEIHSAEAIVVETYKRLAPRDENSRVLNERALVRKMYTELKKALPHFEPDVLDALIRKNVSTFALREQQPFR